MQRFWFERCDDVSGSSGTGMVAEGCVFAEECVSMRWKKGLAGAASTVTYDCLADLEAVRSHQSRTRDKYVDALPA